MLTAADKSRIAKQESIKEEKARIMDRFNAWYNQDGHWVYASRDAALAKWLKDGIEGLPAAVRQ